ncbi:MAG: tetratricopeptide repeat protein [Bacteroidota bacterium]
MSNEITYEKWEEYLSGSLDLEEKNQLDTALQANENLRQQLAIYQEVRAAIQDEQLTSFRQTLQQVQQEQKIAVVQKKKALSINYRWIAIAATVIGLAVLAWFLRRPTNAGLSDPAQLYAQYAQHEISLQEMSTDPELGTIQSLLQEKKYGEALPLITTYLTTHPGAADVLLAQAIAQLETDNTEQALETLATLESSHPIYVNEARWYRALTYLKMKKVTEARTALLSIPDSSSRYQKAKDLLQKIRD